MNRSAHRRALLACISFVLAAAMLVPAAACASTTTDSDSPPASLEQTLRSALAANPLFPGVAAVVDAPGLHWSSAVGIADRSTGRPLTAHAPLRIASVTKTFTAATILRLVEQQRLRLDDPISHHLDGKVLARLRNDGYRPGAITIAMLLRHTSGIYDYATNPAYQAAVARRPHHRWTRNEQIRFATDHGGPLAAPGSQYHYSDTGYLLLGAVIEGVTRLPAAAAYRSLLPFDRLRLDHTYLETLEPTRGDAPRAHQYLAGIDSHGFDPSFDLYGGGGLVSTLGDLSRFYRGLFDGHVFSDPRTLEHMRGAAHPTRPDQLGLGLFAIRLGNETCYGHQGFWGTDVTHCPDSDITIATTVNQAQAFEQASVRLHTALHALALTAETDHR